MRYLLVLSLLYSAARFGGGVPAEPVRILVVGTADGEIVAEPLTMARFGFRLEAGDPPERGWLECEQRTEQRVQENVRYPVLILECDGDRRLVLTGVDLTTR